MNCSLNLIAAYLDEELDAGRQAAVEEHMASCPDCSAAYARLREQRADIRNVAPYYSAPPDLRQSIRKALASEAPVRDARWQWLAIAASVLLAVSISWNLLRLRPSGAENTLAENVVADHVRSLLGNHLLDVTSSDRHTVKPWFAGKLDFSPKVADFEGQGFPLAGGRVEYLAGRRVAALVYHRRQHVINLFIWPQSGSGARASRSREGYNLIHWTEGGMTYWAVSDVSPEELETFRSLFSH